MNEKIISIVVLTYNSEKWILETLESIKNQAYKNLEIIITDDNSTDRTVEISKKWINENKKYFRNTKILLNDRNQGVVKNINKGIRATTTDWIKLIAGDDILFNDCIRKNIDFCEKYDYDNLFSKVVKFKDTLKIENIIKDDIDYSKFDKTAKEQFEELCKNNFVLAPTVFLKKKLIENMNYFDENYPMIEDYPMWLKMTENNIKLNFMNENTVYYRIHSDSISNIQNKIVNERIFEFRKKIYINYISKRNKNPYFHYREKLSWIRNEDIIRKGNKSKWTFLSIVTYIVDPFIYLKILKKFLK